MRQRRSCERFGPFVVHECLGIGGMAMVHRATIDNGTGFRREVALKRLVPDLEQDPAFIADFVREAALAAKLDHPHIVRTHELGRADGRYYITMELVRGAPLSKLGRPPLEVLLAILIELCEAIEHATTFGIIHRDISPANVLVTDDGHAKLVDFGVASVLGAAPSGVVKGTMRYMAPEAATAPETIDGRADVYSVGALAAELLDATCPRSVERVVRRAMAPDRRQRWASAAAMRNALVAIAGARRQRASSLEVARWLDEARRGVPASLPSGPVTRRELPRHVA